MRKPRFTIYHGLAASIAIHSALGLPVVLYALAPPPEEPPALVVELQGLVAETQTEEKVVQETKGQPSAEAAKPAENPAARQPVAETPPPPPPETEPTPSPTPPPKPQAEAPPPPEPDAETPQPKEAETPQPKEAQTPQPKEAQTPQPQEPERAQPKQAETPPEAAKARTNSTAPGAANVKGDEEKEQAQTIKLSEEEFDRLRKYVKGLTKRVQSHLRYPDEGRRVGLQGAATVSFTILSNGQIWPESLKIVESSGQQKLDASALQTVRSSGPFEPPPKEMTVAIDVVFGRKR